MILDGSDPVMVSHAVHVLARGGLLAFPTETVYGLGARADDDAAVAAIFLAKGRPATHPLIVHVADASALSFFSHDISAAASRLMTAFWPGPLTVIVPRRSGRAGAAAGGQDSIGLRMPAHAMALELLREAAKFGVPGVAGPSANRFGHVSPTRAQHVADEFGDMLPVLDGGDCAVGIESAIVDCTREQPALLRPGQLSRALIEQALGRPLAPADQASPRSPGMLQSHYAPRASLHLFDASTGATPWSSATRRPGSKVGVYSSVAPVAAQVELVYRQQPAQAAALAHDLFAALREFDATGVSEIWVQRPPPDVEWDGVRDRLQRASWPQT